MYKAYIFDFDYTLANSEKGIVMCFERLFADEGYGPFPKDVIRRTIRLLILLQIKMTPRNEGSLSFKSIF